MKLLIDNALSPQIASALRESGYDAIHVRDTNLQAAPDEGVFAEAERDDRVIVSADTDSERCLLFAHRCAHHSFCSARLPACDPLSSPHSSWSSFETTDTRSMMAAF
jgi:hypothetical protein